MVLAAADADVFYLLVSGYLVFQSRNSTPTSPFRKHMSCSVASIRRGQVGQRNLFKTRQPVIRIHKLQVVNMSQEVPVASPGSAKLGFVGIGIMGNAMAANLLKAGYQVNVWNRSADKCNDLQSAGAKVCGSAKEVAQVSDITFGMLADPAAALAVAVAAEGVAAGMSPGKGYVDVSTVDSDCSSKIAQAVRATGAQFVEAPVSGSKAPAEQGTLIFLAAGDKQLYDASAAPLDVMGKAKFYLGEVGAGANMKLVVNMVMGTWMASMSEGLILAKQAGLKEEDLVEVLGLGAMANGLIKMKGPAMVQRNYPTAFPLKHQQKDLRLALGLGEETNTPLPVCAAANQLYLQAKAQGQADADFSAVVESIIKQVESQPQ
eukprot:TRINITY_DN1076_c0_g1_i3.p1 TRINITY_DN1076_c0_g1~~TRINITY_DN1076_c0_g1_i3.p1  ORF type:complete len:376 (-),score=95.40 TRINITY_DN1076_c0_g1_i3:257-1384(-)